MNNVHPLSPEPSHPGPDDDDCLSAFLDGEIHAADSACARWRDQPAARRNWHAYHLIGDVMRSDELASVPSHDAAFLAGLRTRLAAEPVVLAPAVAPRRQRWLMPVAAAAGFVVVAGVLVLMRTAAPDTDTGAAPMRMAEQTPQPAPAARASAVRLAEQQPPIASVTPDSAIIRNARLDEYLRAHQAAGGLAVATPGGWLRRVDAVVTAQPER